MNTNDPLMLRQNIANQINRQNKSQAIGAGMSRFQAADGHQREPSTNSNGGRGGQRDKSLNHYLNNFNNIDSIT